MGLVIHETPQLPKLIRMGHAPEAIEPTLKEEGAETVLVTQPPEPVKNKRGRPKKMAKEDLSNAGTETIREDDPAEQGAIGTHGRNAPAQEKVPEQDAEQDKEGK